MSGEHIANARRLRPILEQASASLDDKTASEAAALFPRRKLDGSLIAMGTRINENGRVLKAAVDLWDTEENSPEKAADLWEEIAYRAGYRVIPSVITVTGAFSQGERGWWGDVLMESTVDGNVYTPDAWPGGWKVAEE